MPAFLFQNWPTVSSWAAAVPSSVDSNHHTTLGKTHHAQIFHSAWIFSIHTINFCITLIASCTSAGTEICAHSHLSRQTLWVMQLQQKSKSMNLTQSDYFFRKATINESFWFRFDEFIIILLYWSSYIHHFVHEQILSWCWNTFGGLLMYSCDLRKFTCSAAHRAKKHPPVRSYYFHHGYFLIKCQQSLN